MSLVRALTPFKSSSSFSPADLPNLVRWLDSLESSTLTLSGSSVVQWDDMSPLAAAYTSEFGGNPTLSSSSGLPTVEFDTSTNQILGSGTTQLINTSTGFFFSAVVKLTSDTLGLFFAANKNNTSQLLVFGITSNPAYSDIFFSSSSDGVAEVGLKAASPNGFSTDLENKRVCVSFAYDGSGYTYANAAAFRIWFNGTQLSTTSAAAVGSITGDNTLGGWGNNGNRATGGHNSFILCNSLPSDALINKTIAWQKSRFGI